MAIDPNLDNEVSFITGVTSGGQIAGQSFWAWNGDGPATYANGHAEKWGAGSLGTSGGVVTYDLNPGSNWTPTEQNAFAAAFALWSEVANIQFVQDSTSPAQIEITRSTAATGSEGGLNYTPPSGGGTLGSGTSANIKIATSVPGFGPLGASLADYGGYPYMTLIHEIGHAIGLGHAGPYDANVTTGSSDDQAQFSAYDLQAYSVMSYIEAGDRSGAHAYQEPTFWNYGTATGDNGDTYASVPVTPQIADILAVQRLYGLPTSTPLSGGQTFGFNCNVQGPTEQFFDFTKNTAPIVTLWDAGGGNTLDLSGYSSAETINLNQGAFSSCAGLTNNLAIAYGAQIDTVKAGSGTVTITGNGDGDVLYAGSGTDVFQGGGGADVFYAGGGDDTFIGGSGGTQFYAGTGTATFISGNSTLDIAHLTGSPQQYYEDGISNINNHECYAFSLRNGSGSIYYVDVEIPKIIFGDGTTLSTSQASLASAGLTTGSIGAELITAPGQGTYTFDGGTGQTTVLLPYNASSFYLNRVQAGSSLGQAGAFYLTGLATYIFNENVSTVQFANGQYLSLKDLPAYISGDPELGTGGPENDYLYQDPRLAYQIFIGGGGEDNLFLNGNTRDYTLKYFSAVSTNTSVDKGGDHYAGTELIANNGSGILLIDASVGKIHFQNGQYLAYSDLPAYIPASTDHSSETLEIGLSYPFAHFEVFSGTTGNERALLNYNASDLSLSRDSSGDFLLTRDFGYSTAAAFKDVVTVNEDVSTVQFANGQYLSLKDLGAYIQGSDVFTQGTSGDDLLFTPASGDSYVVGGGGIDNLFLTGNTHDYTIQAVNVAATSSHAAVNGYELVADNGSGNVYIDNTVETIHFQNGQYLAFHDLTAYIDPFHG